MQNRSNRFGFAVFSRKGRRSRKSEVGSQKSEVRSRKSEVGSQKSEVRSRNSEVRSRNSEVRSRKSEVALLGHQSQDDYDIYFEEICQQMSLPDRSQWTADEAKQYFHRLMDIARQ